MTGVEWEQQVEYQLLKPGLGHGKSVGQAEVVAGSLFVIRRKTLTHDSMLKWRLNVCCVV